MPQQNRIHKAVLATAVGVSMLGGTFVLAEHRDDLTTTGDTTYAERSSMRQSDLSGGFFDDRYKTDDWFYDFYESSSATHGEDRTRTSSPGLVRTTDDTRIADAARATESSRHAQADRTDTYNDYYSDRWFYEGRDPAYVMPMTSSSRPMAHRVSRDEDMVAGKIDSLKQVRNRNEGGQNTVALIKTADKRSVIADLGPTPALLDLALTEGDQIKVGGHREDVGPYSVLMAHHVKTGVHHVWLNRGERGNAEYRQVDGRVDQFRDVRVRRDGDMHRVASVDTGNGRFALVDFGPSTAENVPANIAPGDRMTASGRVIRVGNYPVLVADQASFKDGQPIRIARPDGELGGSTRRPYEASQQERMSDHTCIGGGCEGTIGHPGTRDKHSNAMDGVIRPEPR